MLPAKDNDQPAYQFSALAEKGNDPQDECLSAESVLVFGQEDTSLLDPGTCRPAFQERSRVATSLVVLGNDLPVFRERNLEGTLAVPCRGLVRPMPDLAAHRLSSSCRIRLALHALLGVPHPTCRPLMLSA